MLVGQEFAQVHKCFLRVLGVCFFKQGAYAAEIQFQLAVIQREGYGIQIGFQAGLEQQALVEAVLQLGVSGVGYADDFLHLFQRAVAQRAGVFAGESVQQADFVLQRVKFGLQLGRNVYFAVAQCLQFPGRERHALAGGTGCLGGGCERGRVAAVAGIGFAPFGGQLRQQCRLLLFGFGSGILAQHRIQSRRQSRCLAQIAQAADAGEVRILQLLGG